MVMLFAAGIMQAAHYHKSEPLSGGAAHSLCALCIHADRWIDSPGIVPAVITFACLLFKVSLPQAPDYFGVVVRRYNSRAPPRI